MKRRVARPVRRIRRFTCAATTFIRVEIPLSPPLPARLTEAEREVVRLILEGKSNPAIARARGVAVRTVANQVASILRKVRVGSRSALLARLAREATES